VRIVYGNSEVRISLERVTSDPEVIMPEADKGTEVDAGGDEHTLTAKGVKAAIEFVAKSRVGPYFLWPQDFLQGLTAQACFVDTSDLS
jgi:hypothetical protein